MKTELFTLLLAAIFGYKLPAQCPSDINFSTQGQIDSFPINFPGCTAIPGEVTIRGNGITHLEGLNGLVSIGGDLIIGYPVPGPLANPLLTNLDGLTRTQERGS